MEDVFESFMTGVDVTIGDFDFNCRISRVHKELHDTESTRYALVINRRDYHFFEAQDSAEAIRIGLARLGEVLYKRINSFDGNPFSHRAPTDEEIEEIMRDMEEEEG